MNPYSIPIDSIFINNPVPESISSEIRSDFISRPLSLIFSRAPQFVSRRNSEFRSRCRIPAAQAGDLYQPGFWKRLSYILKGEYHYCSLTTLKACFHPVLSELIVSKAAALMKRPLIHCSFLHQCKLSVRLCNQAFTCDQEDTDDKNP